MMKPFRERNPVLVGAVSIAVLMLLLVGAFRAKDLPIIGGGPVYYADFSEAGGLASGDQVMIAGVRVGRVEQVSLAGDHVRAKLRLTKKVSFGEETRADIKVKTLLGAMAVQLEPAGPGQLAKGSEIPVSRTTSPYDVVQAFQGLSNTAGQIDTQQLANALTTIADLTRTTPQSFKAALQGVSQLSQDVAAKNSQIGTLLENLKRVSTVLDQRDGDIITLMQSATTLFDALDARRQSIHNLLVSTSDLSQKLTALIGNTRQDLKPALDQLGQVVAVLNKNEDNIDESLRLMAPFYRVFANTLGSGPWFDTYIQNMPPVPNGPGQ